MRISVDPKSPHFSSRAFEANVYLDGRQLYHCVTADDEAGIVECYRLDDQGRFVPEGEFLAMTTLYGRVTIILKDFDFDAWMRRRRDAAHADLMSRNCGIAY